MLDPNASATVILHSSHHMEPGAFDDPRVFLHRTGDNYPCVSFCNDKAQVGAHQACDGPTHLIVGRRASDSALQRMAARCGVNVSDLVAFRDQRTDEEEARV